MQYIFTDVEFYTGVHDWLYLFQHMALKAMNEAVVEVQGKYMNMHGTGVRNPAHDMIVKEAMIHYQGPHPARCEAYLIRALDLHFSKHKNPRWKFLPKPGQQKITREESKVLKRISQQPSKLPFLE